MSKRKTIGWVIFAALMLVLVTEVPGIGSLACYQAGSRFYATGKYQAAATAFNAAVFLDRRFGRAYIELGSSYIALKKYKNAEQAFLNAKRINDDSCAACGLGMTYYGLRRTDAAESEFQRAMSLNPRDSCAYFQRAKMYYELGRYQDAIAGFKQVLTMQPYFGTYAYLGNAYVFAREYEAGVDAYKQSIQLNPKYQLAHYQLGAAYDYLGRFDDAAAAYREAIKLDPKDEVAHHALAKVYLSLHNKPAALEQYEILRTLSPGMAADLSDDLRLSQARERGKETLYFVPLNNYSAASLTRLVNFCKQKLGVRAVITEPVPFALSTIDKRRQQVIAEEAIELMKLKNPKLAADPNAVLIGLTDQDMYIRNDNSQYAFSYRRQARYAVVSSARLNPANLGGAANDILAEMRTRKMVLKNIGVLYYLYPTNFTPTSVLYEAVESVEDLDQMGEDF